MAMTLRLTEEQNDKLAAIAEDFGVSKQVAIVKLIEAQDTKANRRKLMRETFDLVMTRDAELMQRLADA